MIFDLMVLKDRGHAALQVPLTPAGRMGWALQTHRRDRVADALPDRLDTRPALERPQRPRAVPRRAGPSSTGASSVRPTSFVSTRPTRGAGT
jgi:hypothetical protein